MEHNIVEAYTAEVLSPCLDCASVYMLMTFMSSPRLLPTRSVSEVSMSVTIDAESDVPRLDLLD